jgi:hypothetical protein
MYGDKTRRIYYLLCPRRLDDGIVGHNPQRHLSNVIRHPNMFGFQPQHAQCL